MYDNLVLYLLHLFGITIFEDGSTVEYGCIFPAWGYSPDPAGYH